MLTYVLRRLALSIPLLVLVSILTFVLVALIPGDPAVRILGAGHTAAEYRQLDRQLGLTQPILTQYWHWLDRALHGSLGTSLFSLQSVASEVNQRLGATISLVVGAALVSLIVGVTLGTISAISSDPLSTSARGWGSRFPTSGSD
jgi:peptide/nickel transport system permease protein